MVKNAFLSIKKSIGKTVLLFILMCVIANLVIVGLLIKSTIFRSMNQIRTSLGSEVTLSYNIQNMMKNRNKDNTMEDVMNYVTLDMAEQLKQLDYVENYHYSVSLGVTSNDIEPIEADNELNNDVSTFKQPRMMDENDFTVVGYSSMTNISAFVDENYVLTSGRLLTEQDSSTANCVIETNLANDNDLKVGDTLTVTATHEDQTIDVKLTIVGIYKIQTTQQLDEMMSNCQNPMNQIYTDLLTAQKLNNNMTEITTATYYLDDPEHIQAFKELAKTSTNIDFETYTLDANDQIYQKSISSLQNIEQFSSILLWVFIVLGSLILCMILTLTMHSRLYEFGVYLSLGQSKLKIILQQLCEIVIIAMVALIVSLGTGRIVLHVVDSMLEIPQNNQNQINVEDDDSSNSYTFSKRDFVNDSLIDVKFDVSLTTQASIQLIEVIGIICIISVILPSIYILRLSPREILIKKERKYE